MENDNISFNNFDKKNDKLDVSPTFISTNKREEKSKLKIYYHKKLYRYYPSDPLTILIPSDIDIVTGDTIMVYDDNSKVGMLYAMNNYGNLIPDPWYDWFNNNAVSYRLEETKIGGEMKMMLNRIL